MKNVFTFVLVLLLTSPAFAADKPNVVLMVADNLGFGDLSVYNGGIRGGMKSPRIDQLANEGMRLTQFLVEPACTPSRAGLVTGRYSIRSGLSLVIPPGDAGGLRSEEYTLGEMFKSVGYNTTYVGKWHLGPKPQNQPHNQGYDQWLFGFYGSTDSVVYSPHMEQVNAPQAYRGLASQVLEAKRPGGPAKAIRPYDPEYRLEIEGHIAEAAVDYIKAQAKKKSPFFLQIGWTRPHFPNDTADEFVNSSGVSKYGDSVFELDYRTGQVLDALEEAGVEDNTIVIWISDNGPTITATSNDEIHHGDAGPFRGELGDAYEGSIRTAGMIKWPGKIKPGVSNEMFAIHDFLPTLAGIVGAELPDDRPYDGVDQTDFLLGKQAHSNRESLLSFAGDRIMAVRWRQFRFYPMQVDTSQGNPLRGGYMAILNETTGFPQVYNIEADPKERRDIMIEAAWTLVPYMQTVGAYLETLKEHPNQPGGNVTRF